MNDTGRLLERLHIERNVPHSVSVGVNRSFLLGLCAGIALVATGVAVFWLAGSQAPIPVMEAAPEPVVTTQPLVSTDKPVVLNASGYIVARRQATVSSKITARVQEVLIDEGQRVEENEVIARLDDTNMRAAHSREQAHLAQAKASLHAAELALANEEPLFRRAEHQLKRGIGTQQEFDTAKARIDASGAGLDVVRQTVAVAEANLVIAQRNLDDTIVRAPFSGVVTVKAAQPGEMVSPVSAGGSFTRTGIGTIVDMTSLEVDVDVSESFINRVTAGQPVSVKLNAYPEWSIDGRVITVVPTADRAKATVKVRIALDEMDARILPDMGARVSFLTR